MSDFATGDPAVDKAHADADAARASDDQAVAADEATIASDEERVAADEAQTAGDTATLSADEGGAPPSTSAPVNPTPISDAEAAARRAHAALVRLREVAPNTPTVGQLIDVIAGSLPPIDGSVHIAPAEFQPTDAELTHQLGILAAEQARLDAIAAADETARLAAANAPPKVLADTSDGVVATAPPVPAELDENGDPIPEPEAPAPVDAAPLADTSDGSVATAPTS